MLNNPDQVKRYDQKQCHPGVTVFIAVPFYGIRQVGLWEYVKQYCRPSFVMLPFNIIGELSRTLALAVKLYRNIMSGTVIAGILLSFTQMFSLI